jgi:hypothetical protein
MFGVSAAVRSRCETGGEIVTPARKVLSPGRSTWLGDDLRTRVNRYERRLILAALERTGGHQARAAEALGVLPTTLHEKMKRLGIHLGPTTRQLQEPDSKERARLAAALAESGGHTKRAAEALHMPASQLREKVRIHRLAVVRGSAPRTEPAAVALDVALAATLRDAFASLRRRLRNLSDYGGESESSGTSRAEKRSVPRRS